MNTFEESVEILKDIEKEKEAQELAKKNSIERLAEIKLELNRLFNEAEVLCDKYKMAFYYDTPGGGVSYSEEDNEWYNSSANC